MENDQVTIALQASRLTGPLGRPILIVCEALDHAPEQLVLLRGTPAGLFETDRIIVPAGPLLASEVDLIQSDVQASLYTSLVFWKGVQAEFEAPR